MRGDLGPHTLIIPTALSLPLLRGAVVGRAPTVFQNDWFPESPIFSNLQFFRLLGLDLMLRFLVASEKIPGTANLGSAVPRLLCI